MTAPRESSLLRALYQQPPLTNLHGMPAVSALADDGSSDVAVGLADASCLWRLGVKGPEAAAWLAERGVALPAGSNCWQRNPTGELVARLGRTEFFLEDALNGTRVRDLSRALHPLPGLYPVPRQDAAFILFGARAGRVLAQTTSFDFRALCRDASEAVLTLMAGISVLLLGDEAAGVPRYRIWCDPSFGPYLARTLLGIVREEGGRATGLFAALGQAAQPTILLEATPVERNES